MHWRVNAVWFYLYKMQNQAKKYDDDNWIVEKKYGMTSLICSIQKEMTQMSWFTKQKQAHSLREWIYSFQGRRTGEEIEFVIDM